MSTKIFSVLNIIQGEKLSWIKRVKLTNSSKYFSRYVRNVDPLPTKYGGKTNVTILPGSGIGPEIMECTLEVLKAAGAPLSYEILTLSSTNGTTDEFENALISIRRNKVALKGNIEIQSKNPYHTSRNVLLRKTLDLFVYILSCKTYPGLLNKFGDMDIVVIRQNTEGEYLMLEHEPRSGSVESLKILTRYNAERLVEFAFNFAMSNNRKLITVVHNADVQGLTEGLFLEAALKLSNSYPAIKMDITQIGTAVVKMASNPKLFDIILATNLNGSIVSNYLCGMLGGPGLSAGINLSDSGIAVFEPGARNKGSSIVGRGIANPVGMIMSGINLLNYLGYLKTAETIQKSVFKTLVYDKIRTHDLGGKATTKEITEKVIHNITEQQKPSGDKNRDILLLNSWKSYCDEFGGKIPD